MIEPRRIYQVQELDHMRRNLEIMLPRYGIRSTGDRVITIEEQLRTHIFNGTEPEALEHAAQEHMTREYERREKQRVLEKQWADAEKANPRNYTHEWFDKKIVAKPEYNVTATDLYNSLCDYVQSVDRSIVIPMSAMEDFLEKKGHPVRRSFTMTRRCTGIAIKLICILA